MADKSKYAEVYSESINQPDIFWGKAAEDVVWNKKWDKVLDDSKKPFYRWFSGGEVNTCDNALDYQVESGRGEQNAIIYDSPVTNTVQKITYKELLDKVSKFAGAISALGVKKGDTVIIYMPMIPEALVAVLSCARIGAVHSVVFGGFAPNELAIRIDDAKPKIIISASCGIEGKKTIPYKPLLDEAIKIAAHKPQKCVIYQRPQVKADMDSARDLDFNDVIKNAKAAGCVSVAATDPLYILYTSGTTGKPKGVMRDNGGHAVALKWSMKNIYDVKPGDVFWAASDVGWVVGHSYIIYAPLLYGCTTIVYEGKPVGTPDPGAFWRVISQHGVSVLFTAPTAVRAINKEYPNVDYLKKYGIKCLRYLFLAGERLDPDTYHWACDMLKIPVVDHWWQTETGGALISNLAGVTPSKPSWATLPLPGIQPVPVDEPGKESSPNPTEVVALITSGNLCIKAPWPGILRTTWGDHERCRLNYFTAYENLYFTGDGALKDEQGNYRITGRVDDVLNVSGHPDTRFAWTSRAM